VTPHRANPMGYQRAGATYIKTGEAPLQTVHLVPTSVFASRRGERTDPHIPRFLGWGLGGGGGGGLFLGPLSSGPPPGRCFKEVLSELVRRLEWIHAGALEKSTRPPNPFPPTNAPRTLSPQALKTTVKSGAFVWRPLMARTVLLCKPAFLWAASSHRTRA